MEEVPMPEVIEVCSSTGVQLESEKPKTIRQALDQFDQDFDNALKENSDDVDATLDIRCLRKTLVDETLPITVYNCDQILLRLGYDDDDLKQQIKSRMNSISLMDVLTEFDQEHTKILSGISSNEEDEIKEGIESDQLRLRYLTFAITKASNRQDFQEIIGRIPEHQTYLSRLVEEKMTLLSIETRAS